MKKFVLLVLSLSCVIGFAYAEAMQPSWEKTALQMEVKGRPISPPREAPAYTFTKPPTSLMENYYDYMIGSYNGIPIRVMPDTQYPGYFITYHGRRTPTGTRRVFYAHLDASGNLIGNNEITPTTNHEGFSTLAVDPVSSKPFYAWHANFDADANLETLITSDAFLGGTSGLFNEIQEIASNPYTVTPPVGDPTTDNEFIWPTAQIGPSPVTGMSRIYVVMRNYASHTYGPSENVFIAYADFNGTMIESAIPLGWNHTSIPEMDQWNHDATWRRPFHAITADDLGNLYYAGYHFATEADGTTHISEQDVDIFKCDNYGEGTWIRISEWSHIPTWNPAGTPGGTGYFVGDGSVPYPDDEMVWALANSSHLNAVTDNNGRIIFPGLWAVSTTGGGYWADFQVVKSMIFDTTTEDFTISEIYPIKDPSDTHNQAWTPWDVEAPWGEPEYYTADDNNQYLNPQLLWPFPHWDETLHTDAMMFHYNNIKISEANDEGMMVAVWQDSRRALEANVNSDPEYAEFSQVPEIYISYTEDNGNNWSEPIILNSVEVPQFAGIKPMWVYPADKMIYVGMENGHKVGKIGLLFYNDYTWGANAQSPPAHPTNDGGQVMFMELMIGSSTSSEDDSAPVLNRLLNPNYPNPFNPETNISFDMPQAGPARLDIYNVKGQLVKTLFDGTAAFGRNSMIWNGTDNSGSAVTSGVYFYRLTTTGHSETRKMMLMK